MCFVRRFNRQFILGKPFYFIVSEYMTGDDGATPKVCRNFLMT
jgi:hypothetical protein